MARNRHIHRRHRNTKHFFIFAILIVLLLIVGMDLVVTTNPTSYIYNYNTLPKEKTVDAILVLGCDLNEDGSMSQMLQDRLDVAFSVYLNGNSDKIILSGDDGQDKANEVHEMLHYMLDKGVPSYDIFCDNAGYDVYDSIYRARHIFGVNSLIVVAQKYQLYRAIYLARGNNIEVSGVSADLHTYSGTWLTEFKEVLARDWDCIKLHLHKKSKVGGIQISLEGDSTLSWAPAELLG